jgi:mono/diheme cytochrome c family protein
VDPSVATVALLILVPAALLWALFLMRNRMARRPGALLGIPRAMRPGQPDGTLEGPRLERVQVGGLVFTLTLAFFIPVYWLPEASRQASFQERFDDESLTRGRFIFQAAPPLEEDIDPVVFKEEEKQIALGMGCANCHGGVDETTPRSQWAGGGLAMPAYIEPESGAQIQYHAPPLRTVFQRWDEEIVRFTIERGRPGTPMPAWGVAYGGPMTSQMVDDVITFLHSLPGNTRPPEGISESCAKPSKQQASQCGKEIFAARCAVCHGPEGQGKEAAGTTDDPWYQGLALWKGDVRHLDETQHRFTIAGGRRFGFMPPFAETPPQGVPAPPYPLTDKQIDAVMQYERGL